MEAKKKYTKEYLEDCSYRALQQIAKSMCLPCNFKKIYLKELILDKYVKSERELKERINYIKLERKNLTFRRKTLSESSYFKDSEKNSIRLKSPPITATPKRIYIPRRFSPRFKNVFIKYRPKFLHRRSASPKTYFSSKLINIKNEIKDEVGLNQNTEIFNDDKNAMNVTPNKAPEVYNLENKPNNLPEEPKRNDIINVSKETPPVNIIGGNYPLSNQGSHSSIKNISEMCDAILKKKVKRNEYQGKTKSEVPNATDSSEINKNIIETYIHNNFNNQPTNIKHETSVENNLSGKENDTVRNSLPRFADAFANICSLPWVNQMQVNNYYEKREENYENYNEQSILDFPDEFGFQNSYSNIEENNSAVELLDSFMESPERVDASMNVSDLVDQLYGQINHTNYMQNIVEDLETVQCVICSGTGPKNVLEEHIKQKHSTKIHKDIGGEWSLKFNLGSLTCLQIWCSEVLEYNSLLYLISVKYQDPDYCMATISMLSSKRTKKYGSITLYNSLTGEPHIWKGPIRPSSTNLPYYNENRGLKIKLEKLNLLPNSANLKLINRELVNSSLSKVIVGQPVLNNVHLMVYVKIL